MKVRRVRNTMIQTAREMESIWASYKITFGIKEWNVFYSRNCNNTEKSTHFYVRFEDIKECCCQK